MHPRISKPLSPEGQRQQLLPEPENRIKSLKVMANKNTSGQKGMPIAPTEQDKHPEKRKDQHKSLGRGKKDLRQKTISPEKVMNCVKTKKKETIIFTHIIRILQKLKLT